LKVNSSRSDLILDFLPHSLPADWRQIAGGHPGDDGAAYRNILTQATVIISAARERDGRNWIHFSIAHPVRMPTWNELVAAKELFLGQEVLAIQVIPPRSRYINLHPNCLHLWRCLDGDPVPDFARGGKSI
jgi:hypothetical protein